MTALRATFFFDVGKLLVDPTLLGTSRSIRRDDREDVLTFPATDERPADDAEPSDAELLARFAARDEPPLLEGSAETATSLSVPGGSLAHVHTIRVDVLFDGAVSASDFTDPFRPKDSSVFDPALSLLDETRAEATHIVEGFLAWCRAAGRQPWLGIGGQQPKGIGSGHLFDLDANRRLPVAISLDTVVIHRVRDEQILSEEQLGEYIARVAAGDDPPLGDVLRMDANYFLQHAEPRDPRRALLMAAIACEVRVKAELTDRARGKPAERLIARLIGSKPPEYPAFRLFDEPMKAVSGISMRDDDRGLFVAIDKLFQRRNRLAHSGTLLDEKEPDEQTQAREAATAAREMFVWLRDKLPPPGGAVGGPPTAVP